MPIISTIILTIIFSLNTSLAFGFIPDVKYIYEDTVKGNKDIKTYRITQNKIVYDDMGKKTAEVSEKVFIKQPWKYLKISTKENYATMIVLEGTEGLIVRGGKWIAPKSKISMPFIIGFYLSRDVDELNLFLSSKGIKKPKASLFKMNEVVSIVLQNPAENSPLLCVDRESFWPLAYSYGYIHGKDLEDSGFYYEFGNYRKFTGRKYWPMRMKVFKKGVLKEEIDVKTVDTNVKLPDKIFSIDYLKKKYKPADENIN